jgi:hypothetical protein
MRQALDAVPLKQVSASLPGRNFISTSSQDEQMTPLQKASLVFDLAIVRRDVKGDWIATTLTEAGFRVNNAMVSKWRSPDYTELPTYAHIVALGPEFERAYAKAISQVNKWSRVALMDVVAALGDLAEELS